MRLWRALPLDRSAEATEAGGPLWFPRLQQGGGRHDNPDLYGCLYVAEDPVSAVAELLAPFRGTGKLLPSMLVRYDRPLALAAIELEDGATVVDLDDPSTLIATGLRPSQVATRKRTATQRQAADVYESHPEAVAIRWWSTLESSWINWTLFDRAEGSLEIGIVETLTVEHPVVLEAADLLGLHGGPA
ncbi:MAG TPA: RES family NAD+ phosphorylase [Solirubrobacterales bacterium]|nr:RES family NAD+ phosphorylase [Solirubrobacterales bacterium]